jgi:uncharacterized protein
MPLEGRGTNYTIPRAAVEWALLRAYRGGWPANLVHALGLTPRVRTLKHSVASGRWPRSVRPLRVAFASDLHAGPTTHPTLLDEAFDALAAAKPDVLLLGGDYVFLSGEHIEELLPRIARVPAPCGKFGVLGNHDLWADDRAVTRALERVDVRVLVNERISLPPPFDHVSLTGLDDPWTGTRDATPLDGAGDIRLVLAHAPEALLVIGDRPFDLLLCGHTHGGHIALPGGIPIVSVGPLCRRYPHGRHDVAGRTVVVSRGIGATESALRLNADPDVVVVELAGVTDGT